MRMVRVVGFLSLFLPAFGAFATDCTNQRTDEDIRFCIGEELRQSDQVINDTYSKIMGRLDVEGKAKLRAEQRHWIRARTHICHLDAKITDRDMWLQDVLRDPAKTICVVQFTRTRIATLKSMLATGQTAPQAASQSNLMPMPQIAYDGKRSTTHASGKYYFEFTVNSRAIASITPTVIVMGVSDRVNTVGTMLNITSDNMSAPSERIGIAVDLDNGKLYHSENGAWVGGPPGSNQGTDLKLGRPFYGVFMISANDKKQEMLDRGAFVPNYGDHPFAYAIPDGYSPWRSQQLQ